MGILRRRRDGRRGRSAPTRARRARAQPDAVPAEPEVEGFVDAPPQPAWRSDDDAAARSNGGAPSAVQNGTGPAEIEIEETDGTLIPGRQCPTCGRRQVQRTSHGRHRCRWCHASWDLQETEWPDVTLCLWLGEGDGKGERLAT